MLRWWQFVFLGGLEPKKEIWVPIPQLRAGLARRRPGLVRGTGGL